MASKRRSAAGGNVLRPGLSIAALGTLALIAIAILDPAAQDRAVRAYLLFVLAIAIWMLARDLHGLFPGVDDAPFARLLRPSPRRAAPRPAQLEECATLVRFATSSAGELQWRLRPVLREVAAARLATRRGINLDRQPEEARACVKEATWELIGPERPRAGRFGPGLARAALGASLDDLEQL